MGDRANIAILPTYGVKNESGLLVPVVLYGHWSGSTYIEATRSALSKQWRWSDDAYLTRIIYDEFVGEQAGTETGFGIAAGVLRDNEHPILHVNVRTQRVSLHDDLEFDPPDTLGISFEDFVLGKSLKVE